MKNGQLERWRNEVLSRLNALQLKARQTRQFMESKGLRKLEDNSEFAAAWQHTQDLFPEDLRAERAGDLSRHVGFAERCDFEDIELADIPAVIRSVQRYGRKGAGFIQSEIERVSFASTISDLIHPQVKDACADLISAGKFGEAATTSVRVLMDELRRLSESHGDGDALIRKVIGVQPKNLAFSDCADDNSKHVTEGLKQIAQGLYKGVRNPPAHGWDGFGYTDVLQVVIICSFLLTRLQIVEE